jgi:hypothetical protein
MGVRPSICNLRSDPSYVLRRMILTSMSSLVTIPFSCHALCINYEYPTCFMVMG